MRVSLRSKYSVSQIIQLLLLFLISLNFGNLYFYLIFATFFLCVFVNFRHVKIDIIFVVLVLFSISYILFFPPSRTSVTSILKQFVYPMCYLIGFNLFGDKKLNNWKNINFDDQIKVSIFVTSFGMLFHYILNAITNYGSAFRNTVDFWTGDVLAATGQALLAVMAMSVFSVWLVGECSMGRKLLSLFGLTAIFTYNFILAGRTLLALGVIIIGVALLYSNKHTHIIGRSRNYIFLIIIFIGLLFLFINNVWGIRNWILGSNLTTRFESQNVLEDVRFARKLAYITRVMEFPLGGGELRKSVGAYAHELYLDVYSDVGIFGYIFVIIVVVVCAVNVIKLIRTELLSIETRCLLLCVFLGINIVFLLEPILQGTVWLFCVLCFLSGIVQSNTALLRKDKNAFNRTELMYGMQKKDY